MTNQKLICNSCDKEVTKENDYIHKYNLCRMCYRYWTRRCKLTSIGKRNKNRTYRFASKDVGEQCIDCGIVFDYECSCGICHAPKSESVDGRCKDCYRLYIQKSTASINSHSGKATDPLLSVSLL